MVTPDFQPTRRQVLGRLTTAGLVSAASGSPLGSLVKAFADDSQLPPRGQAQATLFDFKVEEITEKVSRGIERGQALDELKKTITLGTLTSLNVEDMSRRVERELGTLFPVPETPAGILVASVTSNVQEVFNYFTQRKGKHELPLQ